MIKGVGKSCISMQATKDKYDKNYNTTIGFEFSNFNLKIQDKVIRLQIWV